MKYLPLLWSNLGRKKTRTLFTLLCVTAAFMLFGLLMAIRQGFLGDLRFAGAERIVTQTKVFATGDLPLAYEARIARIPGVVALTPITGFGGYFRDKNDGFPVLAVDPQAMLKVYDEIKAPDAQVQKWLADRTGMMVGIDLARRMGWKVGDHVPVNAYGATQKNGSHTWDVTIDAIYTTTLPGKYNAYSFIHYKYFDESRASGEGTVGEYDIRVAHAREAPAISRAIDKMFVNSAPQTDTQPQTAEVQDYLTQFGDVGAIVIAIAVAVFFSMLLVTANTMGQAVRERTAELATLKALGFGNVGMATLVLAESVLVTAIGGFIGLALSYWLVAALQQKLVQFFDTFGYSTTGAAIGVGLIALFGVLAGLLPTLEVAHLRIVNALRSA